MFFFIASSTEFKVPTLIFTFCHQHAALTNQIPKCACVYKQHILIRVNEHTCLGSRCSLQVMGLCRFASAGGNSPCFITCNDKLDASTPRRSIRVITGGLLARYRRYNKHLCPGSLPLKMKMSKCPFAQKDFISLRLFLI